MAPVYFRIQAHNGNDVGAGIISTIFSDLEQAKQYTRSLIEQRGYSDSDIQIVTTDKEGKALQL
jgi:ribosomal protein S3AE